MTLKAELVLRVSDTIIIISQRLLAMVQSHVKLVESRVAVNSIRSVVDIDQ